MPTMTSTAMSQASVEQLIWKACDEHRGAIPAHQALEIVLDVLLWSRWIPASDGDLIGYFDAMRSLATKEEWSSIQKAIAERSGSSLTSSSEESRLEPESLERLRSALLPVGRALNSGERLQCKAVIEAISDLKISDRNGGAPSVAPSRRRSRRSHGPGQMRQPPARAY